MFFSTVWGWIKRWFDPVTVSKIFILGHHEVLPTMLSFIDIKNIPKQYGGELEFNWGEMPNLDPAIRERATWSQGFDSFPKGPMYWRPVPTTTEGEAETVECIAVGSENQVDRKVRVCTLPKHYKGEPEKVAAEEEEEEEDNFEEAAEEQPAAENVAVENGAATDETATPDIQNLSISEKTKDTKTETAAVAPEAAS